MIDIIEYLLNNTDKVKYVYYNSFHKQLIYNLEDTGQQVCLTAGEKEGCANTIEVDDVLIYDHYTEGRMLGRDLWNKIYAIFEKENQLKVNKLKEQLLKND